MSEMISFGAGVNSVAMTIMLVTDGWQGPIVFADPGAEHPDTYCYIDYFEREWLKARGLRVEHISPLTRPELYQRNFQRTILTKCRQSVVVPQMMTRWCTVEYKRLPLLNWARENDITAQLIGIAYEERHRARRYQQDEITLEYPLIDRYIGRDGCKGIIEDAGLAVPPKSGCYICPFQRKDEWRALYDLRRDLFDEAIALDQAALDRLGSPTGSLGSGMGTTLSNIRDMWDAQLELPLMPDPEYEYQMCECRL